MNDDLLSYYNKELSYIRKLGAEFADENPKIAGRLRIKGEHTEDPHISRLIESFAFIAADIRHKLDDHFPELTDALLGVICPDYQAPIPSMAIVQCLLDETADTGYMLPPGKAFGMHDIKGHPCPYKTVYENDIVPIKVVQARLQSQPVIAPPIPFMKRVTSVLRVDIATNLESMRLSELQPKKLRFFINAQDQYSFRVYELLYNHCLHISMGLSPTDKEAITLRSTPLDPVGFSDEDAIIPYTKRGFSGYRLLSECFSFAEKFLFFDIEFNPGQWEKFYNNAQLYLYFDIADKELEQYMSSDNFLLNCVPVINTFDFNIESIPLDQHQHDYHLMTDQRDPEHYEVHHIDDVWLTNLADKQVEVKPLYGHNKFDNNAEQSVYWVAKRKDSQWIAGRNDKGTDMYISLVDASYKTYEPNKEWTLHVKTTCTSRNTPSKLPFGQGQPDISLPTDASALGSAQCVTAPTPTRRPPLHDNTRWQLMSHLSLDYFTDLGIDGLKNVLTLYNFFEDTQVNSMIEGITRLDIKPTTSRIRVDNKSSIARGNAIDLELDRTYFSGTSAFYFAQVIDRFFAQYCSINSFTQLTVTIKGKDAPLRRWPARRGMQQVL